MEINEFYLVGVVLYNKVTKIAQNYVFVIVSLRIVPEVRPIVDTSKGLVSENGR